MITPSDYALLAAGSYWDIRLPKGDANNQAPIPLGWTVLSQYNISGSGANASLFGNGLSARVYKGPNNEIVISYAGTEFDNTVTGTLTDFMNGNIPLVQGSYSEQAYVAAELYQRVKAEQGSNITFTGHSLGGGLAGIMAVWFNRPAYVFAPAPFEASANAYQSSIVNFVSKLVLPRVKSQLGANLDPALASYNPDTDFLTREANVKAWAVRGEILEANLGMFNWIESSKVSLFKPIGSANQVGPLDMRSLELHSIDLHAAGLLSPTFETEAPKLTDALHLILDRTYYGAVPSGNNQDFLIKLVRAEVGIRDEGSGTQVIAPNGMLTHFANDLKKLTTNLAGLNLKAQDALIAQSIEWYYWQGTDYAGQEFFTQTGALLQYTTAQGANLTGAQNKASSYVRNWLVSIANNANEFYYPQFADVAQWNVSTSSGAGVVAAALNASKSQIFVGQNGADNFTGGNSADVIFAGAGNDTLTGGAGNDKLYGGAGTDTYVFTSGSGDDTIIDAGGQGTIKIDGQTINGGKKTSANTWISDDKKYGYTLVTNGRGGTDLIINKGSSLDRITIRNWEGGQLGITLQNQQATAPTITNTYTGDRILGSGGNDLIFGLGGNESLSGRSGDDSIEGGDGIDVLMGGYGRDTLIGGTGGDYIYGSGNGSQSTQPDPNLQAAGPELARGSNWVIYTDGQTAHGGQIYITKGLDTSTLYGDDGNLIDGGAGNDIIWAGSGDDTVHGGGDDDSISGLSGNDILAGDEGNDNIWGDGTQSNSYVTYVPLEEHGKDVLDGGAGDDYLEGQGQDDILYGGTGNDVLWGDGPYLDETPLEIHGNDTLDGGDGNDSLIGGGRDDALWGGEGNDFMLGDGDSKVVITAAYQGNDYLDGEGGNDTVKGGGADDELYGGADDDQLFGDDRPNILAGEYHGKDYLDGEDGNDYLEGGGNDDELFGGQGNDTIFGDTGPGLLAAEYNGKDYLDGEDGDDELEAGGNDDTLFGGEGNDLMWGDASTPGLPASSNGRDYLDGEAGNDTLNGGGADDELYGGSGDDELRGDSEDTLVGGTLHGADYLNGGEGNDTIIGDGGNDTLDGGEGDDEMRGDYDFLALQFHGNDILNGGAGNDLILGDGGDDILADLDFIKLRGSTTDFGLQYGQDIVTFKNDLLRQTITRFEFADGTVKTWADIMAMAPALTIKGTGNAENITGGNKADSISGGLERDKRFSDRRERHLIRLRQEQYAYRRRHQQPRISHRSCSSCRASAVSNRPPVLARGRGRNYSSFQSH